MSILSTALLTQYKSAFLIGGAVALALSGFAAGWTTNGWRLGAELSKQDAQAASDRADQAEVDLRKYQQGAAALADAASQAQAANAGAQKQFAAIAKEFKNAKPLPADCRPDDDRLRLRNQAIDVYNAARSGQQPGR